MAGTRSSARKGQDSSPPSTQSNGGTKRKAEETSPTRTKSKRGRPSKAAKEQKTLEQTMPTTDEKDESKDVEIEDAPTNGGGKHSRNSSYTTC